MTHRPASRTPPPKARVGQPLLAPRKRASHASSRLRARSCSKQMSRWLGAGDVVYVAPELRLVSASGMETKMGDDLSHDAWIGLGDFEQSDQRLLLRMCASSATTTRTKALLSSGRWANWLERSTSPRARSSVERRSGGRAALAAATAPTGPTAIPIPSTPMRASTVGSEDRCRT